jgi:hypothetical protein
MDRVHDQAALDRNETSQTAIAAFELLADKPVANAVEAGAIVAVYRTAEQTEPRNLRNELAWKIMLLESVSHKRYDLLVDESGNGVLHHAFVVVEFRPYVKQIERIEAFFIGVHAEIPCAPKRR